MSNSPLVSVIVPTYNRPDFLKKTVQAILEQTYDNIEVFVVSNGFNDKNRAAVEAINSSKVTYVEQENSGGPSSPRNHGIRLARGKYVAFCDDDDLWMPEKLSRQVAALESSTSHGLAYTKMIRFDSETEWTIPHEEGEATQNSLLYINTVPISSVIIEKRLVDEFGGFSELKVVGPSEDYEFLLRYITKTKFYFVDEYLLKYWSGLNRTTSTDDSRKIKDSFDHLKTVLGCFFLLVKTGHLNALKLLSPVIFHIANFLKSSGYIVSKRLNLK